MIRDGLDGTAVQVHHDAFCDATTLPCTGIQGIDGATIHGEVDLFHFLFIPQGQVAGDLRITADDDIHLIRDLVFVIRSHNGLKLTRAYLDIGRYYIFIVAAAKDFEFTTGQHCFYTITNDHTGGSVEHYTLGAVCCQFQVGVMHLTAMIDDHIFVICVLIFDLSHIAMIDGAVFTGDIVHTGMLMVITCGIVAFRDGDLAAENDHGIAVYFCQFFECFIQGFIRIFGCLTVGISLCRTVDIDDAGNIVRNVVALCLCCGCGQADAQDHRNAQQERHPSGVPVPTFHVVTPSQNKFSWAKIRTPPGGFWNGLNFDSSHISSL